MEDDWIILNHLIVIAKYYFYYTCKLKKVNASLRVDKAKIKVVYHVEKRIATRRNKLTKRYMGNGKGFYHILARI